MLINAIDPEESRIAVVEDGVLQELHVELANREAYLGNIYKGKVVNIEPSIGAAFVAFGGRVNGFLHVSDVLPAYGRDDFRLDDVIEGRARVDVDDGPESMQQALSDDDDDDDDESPSPKTSARAGGSSGGSSKGGGKKRSASKGAVVAAGDAADGHEPSADVDSGGAVDSTEADDSAVGGADASVGQAERGSADQSKDDHGDDSHGDDVPAAEEASEESGKETTEDDDAVIEAVDDVQVGDEAGDDDGHDDDHGDFGFGHGLSERPHAMAAHDPGGDDGSDGSDHDVAGAPASGREPRSGERSDEHSDEQSGGDERSSDRVEPEARESAGQPSGDGPDRDVADGEAADGPVRKKRSRSRRSRARKGADRGAAADGEAGHEVAAEGADGAENAEAASADEQSGAAGDDLVAPEGANKPARKKRSRRGSGGDGDSRPASGRQGGGRQVDVRQGGNRSGKGRSGQEGHDRRLPRGNRPTIDQLLKKGQEVVVQITKEGIGTKGPTLTTYVSLPGRCLVLMPSLPKCGVSRKIEDGRERRRLKRVVRELDETGSGGIGFIVRTAGIDKSLEDVQRDRDYLKKIWEMVAQRLKVTKAPALLYQESDLVLKAMRDQFTPDIADVVVDSEDVHMRIRDFAEKLMPLMADRIKRHAVTTPLFHSFGIEKDVEELYEPKVDLPNGASIVIDQAEALVAIDVNSGKYKAGGQGSDETAYRTNLETIPEIVRQLRLRDLGGLIIIDFIDMSHEKHRRGVERKIIDALRGDRARIKVGRISPFGMMEITRQRVGPGLKRTVFMQCPHCKGAGWSRTVQSKALSVLREARALVNLKGYSMLQVFVAPAVSDYLVNYKRRAVLETEDAVGKSIVFRPEQSYPIDVVHYRFLTGDGQEARIAIPAGLGVKA